MAQQAAEKLLKSFLLFKGEVIPKSHDLLFLNTRCSQLNADFQHLNESLEVLNLYSIEGRYPGDLLGDISAAEAEEAYQKVLHVKEIVMSSVGE